MKLHTTLVIEHGLDGRTDRNVTGNVAKVFDGDAVEQAERLADLQLVFGTEFDRGELTVESLRPVLWAAHWLKAIRPIAQRASELLALASVRTFEPGSKAARDSDAVSRVMASVATTEPHCLTALEAARKIRVPADFYAAGAKSSGLAMFGPGDNNEQIIPMVLKPGSLTLTGASALRVDGIRPEALLTTEESQALAEQIRSTASAVETVGAELDEKAAHAAEGAGSTVGADDSPFRLYGFAHKMLNALRMVHETTQQVGGSQCYPRVFEALQQASEVLLLINGEAEPQPIQDEVSILNLGQALIDNRERSSEYELARRLHELGYRLAEGAAQ